ncbi:MULTISPECIES: hypothetical protein [Halolamina]|uniref:Uncharacterized protein n=1 Tax=Halolamina pelagica TaxID=699431 RepID=A0A1I5QTH0_9EURY|nr:MULTISPECIES: hypothetical protein [Halolamina]NHX35517.1 hypothetical protein [Halolamina sp. R1-12]SFP49126.1 hypothetical protein SAMN05216277_10461 [Halolamina pelagica]
MAKVSVGLRGWRFDEDEVFTEDGEWAPLDEMPDDARNRLLRLGLLMDQPCDACYLEYGEEEKRRANPAAIVYGEPGDEVLLCDDHEADFLYWFREEGGSELAGEERFRDEFHEWFVAGNRAPEGYGPDEHVEEAPGDMPNLPTPEEAQRRLEQAVDFEEKRYDLRAAEGDDEEGDDLDVADLDLDTEYPSG